MKYLILAAYLVFVWRRLTTYLHIFQQEEYDPVRFVRWLFRTILNTKTYQREFRASTTSAERSEERARCAESRPTTTSRSRTASA